MAYEITYKASVVKELKRLPKKKADNILNKIKKELATNPYAHEKLSGEFEGKYKLVVWPYRVIYEVSGNQVVILRIRHRKESYR